MKTIQVTKASGVLEPFSETKVRQSLQNAGAKPKVIDQILVQLTGQLRDGITTREIYAHVFDLLNQYQSGLGYRYSLKAALMQLGPSGFPFEKFIARLFDYLGYQTKVSVIVSGRCIDYEIDVVIAKDNRQDLIECKYHNRPGVKTHAKDALGLQAKFADIGSAFRQAWLVTNTKLTTNAIKYGECQGLKLLAWRYPADNGLEKLIEKHNLLPLTCFTFLDHQDFQRFFQNNLVLCQDLINLKDSQLTDLGLSSAKINLIKKNSLLAKL
ncbi:MAG: restriction endonuclease [Candidatus Beckwithbacteria bacterium]